MPTAPERLALVDVTESVAGTTMFAVPLFEASATDVAVIVIVCAALVGVGAVNVADVVVVFDNAPALVVHVTPAAFRSLLTMAVKFVLSVPSTVPAAVVTVMAPIGCELPQPAIENDAKTAMHSKPICRRRILRGPRQEVAPIRFRDRKPAEPEPHSALRHKAKFEPIEATSRVACQPTFHSLPGSGHSEDRRILAAKDQKTLAEGTTKMSV